MPYHEKQEKVLIVTIALIIAVILLFVLPLFFPDSEQIQLVVGFRQSVVFWSVVTRVLAPEELRHLRLDAKA